MHKGIRLVGLRVSRRVDEKGGPEGSPAPVPPSGTAERSTNTCNNVEVNTRVICKGNG